MAATARFLVSSVGRTVPASFANRHNFSGGPGALPESVLAEVQEAIMAVPGVGLSLLGISRRTAWFRDVVDEAEENIRALFGLPDHYHVLLLPGGDTLQFSMVPMNLLRGRNSSADYLVTGQRSGESVPGARRTGDVRVVWSGEAEGFTRLPADKELDLDPRAAYLHYASNEMVEGLQFHRLLGSEDVPRVCDMSSDFLSRPVPVQQYALLYAHAQNNLGPAGVTVVILRDDLIQSIPDGLPTMLDYRAHREKGSFDNAPPVFAVYVTLLVTRWLRNEMGGLDRIAALNQAKAERLYALLDASDGFYQGRAARDDRSLTNVVFRLPTRALEEKFLEEAEVEGFYGLEGHGTHGSLRVSLYNAVTPGAVQNLCAFMEDFRERHTSERVTPLYVK
jgi:phosphoserine aminotransferase